MKLGERLRQWRTAKGVNQVQAALILGKAISTYQKYEQDMVEPGSEVIELFAKDGGNANWLLTGVGEMFVVQPSHIKTETAPYFVERRLTDSNNEALIPFYDGSKLTESISIHKRNLSLVGVDGENAALIKVFGDSMEPTLLRNDIVLIDKSVISISSDAIYAIDFGNTLVIRRIQQGLDGSISVISDNQRYAPQALNKDQAAALKIMGVVRWFCRAI